MTQPSSANYAPAEIQAVVQKLVLSTIRQPLDTLGVRRTDLTYADVQQAAAGVFLLNPNSPFYVLQLGCNRLGDQITAEAAILDELVAAITATGRRVLPVTDVSPLFSVQQSLLALASAAAARSGAINVMTAPAYQQFAQNSASFLAGPAGQAVKSNGNIVMTPQQAQAAIPGLLTQLKAAHTQLVASVTLIVNGIANYNGLNLPSVVISSVLDNAASLVGADAATMSALNPIQRLTYVRQAVLNMLATQAVVSTFGVFNGPSDFYTLGGLGSPYSDAQHAAFPASVTSDHGDSYSIVTGSNDTLTVAVDGGAPASITLAASYLATIAGSTRGGFVIGDGTHPRAATGSITPNNNKFKVNLNGTDYVATLTKSGDAEPALVEGTTPSVSGWYGPTGSLAGTTLAITIDGVNVQSATFGTGGAAPLSESDVVTFLNSVFNTTTDGAYTQFTSNLLFIISNNYGSAASILLGSGSANAVFGFTAGDLVTGTTPVRTADQVAANVQPYLPYPSLTIEGYYLPTTYQGLMDIPAGSNQVWSLHVPGSSDFGALGIGPIGYSATVQSGANAGAQFPITAVTYSTRTVGSTDATAAGLYGSLGSLDGTVLSINANGAGYTSLALVGTGNALNEAALLAAIHAQWPSITATVVSTHLVLTSSPPDTFAVDVVGTSTANVPLGLTSGLYSPSWTITVSGSTAAQVGANVQIGPANRALRVRCSDPSWEISAEATLSVYGDDTPSTNSLTTFGMANGVVYQCLQSQPAAVAADINSKTGSLTAGTVFVPYTGPLSTARTDTSSASLVVFAAGALEGTITDVGPLTAFTVTVVKAAGTFSTGDVLAVRSGLNASVTIYIYEVNGVLVTNYTPVVGDVITSFTASTPDTYVYAEFGPDIAATKYSIVSIASGQNAGLWVAAGQGATAIDVMLMKSLPQQFSSTSPTTNTVTLTATFGALNLTFASKNTTTASELVFSGNACGLFFTSTPTTVLGTTPWFRLPSIPSGLQPGDILELFGTTYSTPDHAYEILSVIPSLNLIQVNADIIGGAFIQDGTSWQFSTQPTPFAKLHVGTMNDYSQVQASLQVWLALPENQPVYLTNLNGLINPILLNSNPTAEQVGTALAGVEDLYQFLTAAAATALGAPPAQALDSILATYTVESVPAIDSLIKTYIASGSDRAVDVLLSGDFATFFGLTSETSSYAGNMQAAVRAVAMHDLPLSKVNRSDTTTGRLTAQTTSPDFEYTANAVTEALQGEEVNPPPLGGPTDANGTNIGNAGAGGNAGLTPGF